MSESEPTTVKLKPSQVAYLDKMVEKYKLPDRSKALRCLVNFVMLEPEHEGAAFETIRCHDCGG